MCYIDDVFNMELFQPIMDVRIVSFKLGKVVMRKIKFTAQTEFSSVVGFETKSKSNLSETFKFRLGWKRQNQINDKTFQENEQNLYIST